MIYQAMFAVIAPALISGAFAERKRFKAFVLFSLLWATLVYDPIAHWVWGQGGMLRMLGTVDFAGGIVVHVSSGVLALVAALMLGRRIGFGREPMDPHDTTMTVLGAGLLWFGWFGFNAGSALGANAVAVNAFVVTNTAAAMGALTWMTVSWAHHRQPSVLGVAVGAVAGLATITPAAGCVTATAAILIGMCAAVVCYWSVQLLKARLGIDDALDVFGVHGVGGTMGAIATGIFATVSVNPHGVNGLLFGNPAQLSIQCIAVAATALYAGTMSWLILKVIDIIVGLRVEEREEVLGLDTTQHGEATYTI